MARLAVHLCLCLLAFSARAGPTTQREKLFSLSGDLHKTELWEPPKPEGESAKAYAARVRKSAEAGDVRAQATLGWFYSRGMGHLGNIHLLGHGVPVEYEQAIRFLRPPAEGRITAAAFSPSLALDKLDRKDESATWMRRAAEGGFVPALFTWALLVGRSRRAAGSRGGADVGAARGGAGQRGRAGDARGGVARGIRRADRPKKPGRGCALGAARRGATRRARPVPRRPLPLARRRRAEGFGRSRALVSARRSAQQSGGRDGARRDA